MRTSSSVWVASLFVVCLNLQCHADNPRFQLGGAASTGTTRGGADAAATATDDEASSDLAGGGGSASGDATPHASDDSSGVELDSGDDVAASGIDAESSTTQLPGIAHIMSAARGMAAC